MNIPIKIKFTQYSFLPTILSLYLSPLFSFLNKLHTLFQFRPNTLFTQYRFLFRILFCLPCLLFPQFQFSQIFCHDTMRPVIILHKGFYRIISAFPDDFLQLVFLPGKLLFALIDFVLCCFLLLPFNKPLMSCKFSSSFGSSTFSVCRINAICLSSFSFTFCICLNSSISIFNFGFGGIWIFRTYSVRKRIATVRIIHSSPGCFPFSSTESATLSAISLFLISITVSSAIPSARATSTVRFHSCLAALSARISAAFGLFFPIFFVSNNQESFRDYMISKETYENWKDKTPAYYASQGMEIAELDETERLKRRNALFSSKYPFT